MAYGSSTGGGSAGTEATVAHAAGRMLEVGEKGKRVGEGEERDRDRGGEERRRKRRRKGGGGGNHQEAANEVGRVTGKMHHDQNHHDQYRHQHRDGHDDQPAADGGTGLALSLQAAFGAVAQLCERRLLRFATSAAEDKRQLAELRGNATADGTEAAACVAREGVRNAWTKCGRGERGGGSVSLWRLVWSQEIQTAIEFRLHKKQILAEVVGRINSLLNS